MKRNGGITHKLIYRKTVPTRTLRHKIDNDVQHNKKWKEQKKYGM